MSHSAFPVVDRPGADRLALVTSLIETLRTGKAIHVPLNGKTAAQVRQSLYNPLMRRGYRLRLVQDGSAFARGWVEIMRRNVKRKTA